MCGIVGVISNTKAGLFQDEEAFFTQALITNAIRGQDGTGIFWGNAKELDKTNIFKKAHNPYHLIFDDRWVNVYEEIKKTARFVVGHNRAATKGAVSQNNSHPFQHKHITMVHNGTIHSGLFYPKGVEVDSQALTIALAEVGPKIFSEIYGAFACVWHDTKTQLLHIVKNHERPLHLVKEQGSYFFASEYGMLLWLLHRNKQTPKVEDVKIENNVIYTFDLSKDMTIRLEEEPLPQKKHYQQTYDYGKQYSGNLKQFPAKQKQKQENVDVLFTITHKEEEQKNGYILHTYLCVTDEGETCFFRSSKTFAMGPDNVYFGELEDVHVGAFELYGKNIPWYRIKFSSIFLTTAAKLVGKTTLTEKELDDALKQKCFSCDSPVDEKELGQCEALQVSTTNYRIICHHCVAQEKKVETAINTTLIAT